MCPSILLTVRSAYDSFYDPANSLPYSIDTSNTFSDFHGGFHGAADVTYSNHCGVDYAGSYPYMSLDGHLSASPMTSLSSSTVSLSPSPEPMLYDGQLPFADWPQPSIFTDFIA